MINGVIVQIEPIRHTPVGIPLLSFVLQHASEQLEAGFKRKVDCEVSAVALGKLTQTTIKIGDNIKAKGFLAKRNAKSNYLVLHVTQLVVN